MDAGTKSSRWNLRVAPGDDEVVRSAAQAVDRDLTEFVRFAALKEAEHVLADRTLFTIDTQRWDEFTEQLDRPPRVPEGLSELFSRPSVFR